MTAESDGFLGRWARRKAQARSGAPLPPEPALSAPVSPLAPPAASTVPAGPVGPPVPAPPPPTLQEAQQLTPASDFRPFVARAVAPEVRNAAFKQLFSDPHFNVMDGLDIYIDDYSKPDPLPLALARELLQAHFPSAPPDSAAAAAPNPATGPEPGRPADAVESSPEVTVPAQPPSDPAP